MFNKKRVQDLRRCDRRVCEYDGAITNQRKKSGKRFQRATRKRNFCIDRG